MKRRNFLLAAATAGYFAGVAPAASRLANERARLAILGVGNHGATNLAAVNAEEIAVLCDVDDRYLDEAAARYPNAKKTRDLRVALDERALDGVVISTPDHTHAFAALTAMQRGVNVFCEKPLTHTLDELDRLCAVAATKKLITQVGLQHLSKDGARRAAGVLRAGALGAIAAIHAWTDRPIWPQNIELPKPTEEPPKTLAWDLWLGPAKARPYSSAYHPLRWRGWHEFGSGALGDFGPHLLAPVFVGLELPSVARVAVKATGGNEETFPAASIVEFRFAKTKEHPGLILNWYDGGNQPPRELTGFERLPSNGVLVVGETGKLFIPDYGRAPKFLPARAGESIDLSKFQLDLPTDIHADWIQAVKNRAAPALSFARSRPLMELCLLGNIALRAGDFRWDADKRRILENDKADMFLQREYRTGWKLPGAD